MEKGVVFRENTAKLVPNLTRPLLASTYTSGTHSEMSMCTRTIMTTTCTCSVHMPIQSRQMDKCTDVHTDRCTHRCTVEFPSNDQMWGLVTLILIYVKFIYVKFIHNQLLYIHTSYVLPPTHTAAHQFLLSL